ncbi:hypothetical protein BV20DRAFT_962541 [Pilatotrama ljubarskyi]|nr:hypothetical protein BV20DRAFT_962541 [Pilatotrama ljubarskyi]
MPGRHSMMPRIHNYTHLDLFPPSPGSVAHVFSALVVPMPPKRAPTASPSCSQATPACSLDWAPPADAKDMAPLTPADTLSGLLDQIFRELTFVPGLALRRKERFDKLIQSARALLVIESATQGVAQAPSGAPGSGASNPVTSFPLDVASLSSFEASLKSLTQQALRNFTEQATIAVKASIEAACKAAPRPSPGPSVSAPQHRVGGEIIVN